MTNEPYDEPMTCTVCLQQMGDNIIVITNSETGQVVCETCINELKYICDQVRARIDEFGVEGAAEIARQESLQELDS